MNNISDNTDDSRYELNIDGHMAYVNYKRAGDILTIEMVFTPKELRGRGIAGELMAHIVAEAKAQNLKINPFCGYAKSWLDKQPEYQDIVVN